MVMSTEHPGRKVYRGGRLLSRKNATFEIVRKRAWDRLRVVTEMIGRKDSSKRKGGCFGLLLGDIDEMPLRDERGLEPEPPCLFRGGRADGGDRDAL